MGQEPGHLLALWSNGAADSVWSNSGNNTAIFGSGNGAAGTVTVGTITAGGLIFNAATSGSYLLSGGTLTLGGATPTISANVNARSPPRSQARRD